MFRTINISEAYLYDKKLRADAKEQYQLLKKNVEKIKKIALKKIKYPDFKEAYEYVDNLFPRVKVKNIIIYKVAVRDLAKMGLGGAEGFYDPVSKIVVVCGARKRTTYIDKRFFVEAKVERDEVIVHELCHYCYVFENNRSISSEMREEFAYGWSIGYLRQKGYSDEQIVKYNFLPYLIHISNEQAIRNILARNNISSYEYNNHTRFKRKEFNRKFGAKIFAKAKEIGTEKGLKMISIYSKKLKEGTGYLDEEIDETMDRFDILDL